MSMNIETLHLLYFSPTQTTKKVLNAIADGFEPEAVRHSDLTLPDSIRSEESGEKIRIDDGLTIIGVPVYAGRVAPVAADRIRRFKAGGAPAVLVVLYGNREFEDALRELKDLAVEAGFRPIAGGAFIGEHSFADSKFPIACRRPDHEDLKKCAEFGALIKEKIQQISSIDSLPIPEFPGNYPYRDAHPLKDSSPETLEDLCTRCGTCVSVCPTAAIVLEDKILTATGTCIVCCACVKNCPSEARVMRDPQVQAITEWLWQNYHKRKEPQIFFGGKNLQGNSFSK
jgi:ferredoxin